MGYYIIEISQTNTEYYIAAYDIESDQSYLIQLGDVQGKEIFNTFAHNYDLMADNLRLNNNKLMLMNPAVPQRGPRIKFDRRRGKSR